MSISKEKKQDLICTYKRSDSDTGSVEVQVAILTSRILSLTEHFKTHKKDNHSKRGLLMLVGTRKRLVNYLKKKNYDRYLTLIQSLGMRK